MGSVGLGSNGVTGKTGLKAFPDEMICCSKSVHAVIAFAVNRIQLQSGRSG